MRPEANTFNVADKYKYMSVEEIQILLAANAFPAAVCMMQIQGDFNFGSVVRNANAFGFKEIFYCAPHRKWDKRGAVGAYHYTDVRHCNNIEELAEATKEYTWVALECNTKYNCVNLYDFEWPENPLLLIGEESCGLSDEVLDLAQHIVYIPQYGSVRSINAATAGGIAMSSYASQQSKRSNS